MAFREYSKNILGNLNHLSAFRSQESSISSLKKSEMFEKSQVQCEKVTDVMMFSVILEKLFLR